MTTSRRVPLVLSQPLATRQQLAGWLAAALASDAFVARSTPVPVASERALHTSQTGQQKLHQLPRAMPV